MIMRDHYMPTLEEISTYCDVEGESAFLTCPRFLQRLRNKCM